MTSRAIAHLVCLTVSLGAFVACDETSETPDAGVQASFLTAENCGIRMRVPSNWMLSALTPTAPKATPSRPTAVSAGDRSKKISTAIRKAAGRPMLVAPRVVLTSEPTVEPSPDRVFRTTLEDLRKLGERPGVKMNRTTLTKRVIGTEPAGDIELSYSVDSGKPGAPQPEIAQRTLVFLRRCDDQTRSVISFTATYLAKDADVVAPEVEMMWRGIQALRSN